MSVVSMVCLQKMLQDFIPNAVAGRGGCCQAGKKSNAGFLGRGVPVSQDALHSAAPQGELLLGGQGGGADLGWGSGSCWDCNLCNK